MKQICNAGFPSVSHGYVFGCHDDLLPDYRINSFTYKDLALHHELAPCEAVNSCFAQRFPNRHWAYTASGSHGIAVALKLLELQPDDCVTIFTSTGNSYISGCVTREIEKICRWSREMTPTTKVVFVNHEFGIAYPNVHSLKSYGLPIIEDCCYAFNSATPENGIGQIGDFVIYSFAKYFSIQFGGLLVARNCIFENNLIDLESKQYLQTVLSHYILQVEAIGIQRVTNHNTLSQLLEPLGIKPRFTLKSGEVPGVYMFYAPDYVDLPALKQHLWARGIQCSVFYGEQAFFLPLHQGLGRTDFGYFYACLHHFLHYTDSSS